MIHIRAVRESDAPALREVLDVICRERRYLGTLEAPPIESFQGFVSAVVKAGSPHFVAEVDGKVVGWCYALPGEISTGTAHIGRLAMGVLKDFRGQKIGRDLTRAAIEKARELGLEKIELTVYSSNGPAISLYRNVGFEEEGRKKRGRLVDGIYDDVVLMALI
jgi:ribosomal protein S18 acetylase RimI-like enzyme